jgi:hypothetical protein
VASAPDDTLLPLAQRSARLLTTLVSLAIGCLVVATAGHRLVPDARWPVWLDHVGTAVVVAAPLVALVGIAWSRPSRRLVLFALGGILVTALGALLAR